MLSIRDHWTSNTFFGNAAANPVLLWLILLSCFCFSCFVSFFLAFWMVRISFLEKYLEPSFRNVLSTGGISFFSWLTEPVQNFKTLQWASYFTLMLPSILSSLILTANFLIVNNSSVIRQKGESRNRSKKKVKQSKFSKKWTFLTPWYAHVRVRIKG